MSIARLWRESFRAMGTLCEIAVTAGPLDGSKSHRALAASRAEIGVCERALSRFDPASDLSRLNAASGEWVEVGTRLEAALRLALRAREDSAGRFDPTILPVLQAAGYDRSFELLEQRPPREVASWRPGAEVELDGNGSARVARGSAVDLGGIAKGFAAGRALNAMLAAWPALPGGLADLGGDIAAWGRSPEGSWRLAIADPRRPESTLGTLELVAGGVATSGRDTRRFGPGQTFHHLIDPATGVPARSGPLAVTVVAAEPVEAEAHATALAVTDPADAEIYVAARPHLAALLVPDDGDPVALGRLPLARPSLAAEAVG
jgi:thiamine biosynthesis lipoprotein